MKTSKMPSLSALRGRAVLGDEENLIELQPRSQGPDFLLLDNGVVAGVAWRLPLPAPATTLEPGDACNLYRRGRLVCRLGNLGALIICVLYIGLVFAVSLLW